MEIKGKPVLQLQSPEWVQDFAFIVGITDHLNDLNRMLQCLTLSHITMSTYEPPSLKLFCEDAVVKQQS